MVVTGVGLNHTTAPAHIREKAAFTDVRKIEVINFLEDKGIEEVVILSTCNRSEIYAAVPEEALFGAVELLKGCYMELLCGGESEKYIYSKQGEEAVRHLYRVTAGLDSIVMGEDQILGQVRDAHLFSMNLGSSKKVFNKLFREAVNTAKKIKTELRISENSLSISSIGVKYIKEKMGSLEGRNVFIIGLGKMGRLTLNYILGEKVNKIYMANRNHKKAVDLSADYPEVIPVEYKDRYEILQEAEVLITATSSPHTIIKSEKVKERLKDLYIMDMAIPRDVDEAVGTLPKVHLYNVDDLRSISSQNERLRQELSKKADEIIREDIESFKEWLSLVHVDPVIKTLKEKCQTIEEETLQYIYKKIEMDERDKKILEKMLSSALKRVVREPILRLKAIPEESRRRHYAEVIEELFSIEIDSEE